MYAHVPLSDCGRTNYERVMGHAPHVLRPWSDLEEVLFSRSMLPRELLEQVRRTLALGHGCEYCQAKAGPPSPGHADLKASLAVAFAEAFARDHRAVSEAQIRVLREHFSDAELVELVAFVSFMWAGGSFGKVLGIQPQDQPQAAADSA